MSDRGGLGRVALAADHRWPSVCRAGKNDRRNPAGAIEMRFDDLQREACSDPRIEDVAVGFQYPHADSRCNPMGRGHGAHRSRQIRASGKDLICHMNTRICRKQCAKTSLDIAPASLPICDSRTNPRRTPILNNHLNDAWRSCRSATGKVAWIALSGRLPLHARPYRAWFAVGCSCRFRCEVGLCSAAASCERALFP